MKWFKRCAKCKCRIWQIKYFDVDEHYEYCKKCYNKLSRAMMVMAYLGGQDETSVLHGGMTVEEAVKRAKKRKDKIKKDYFHFFKHIKIKVI